MLAFTPLLRHQGEAGSGRGGSMGKPTQLVFAAMALIALSGSVVEAETNKDRIARTPKKTGDFVPYCTNNFKDCLLTVIDVDIEHLAENNPRICTIKTRDNDAATKSILGWLAGHKETHGTPTRTGIGAAIKALWPC
jgi:hypothetical protein